MKNKREDKFISGISIGLPVYNGENFLKNKLENILNQSYKDFELIVSDNCSTDNTREICEDFLKKDNRIKYFRQEKNMGVTWNVNFVINQAKREYFLLTAVDDLITDDFLEKNLKVLSDDKKFVGSIGKIISYETSIDSLLDFDKSYTDLIKNLRQKTRPRTTISLEGSYNKKVRKYLKKSTCQVIYGLFRTKEFKMLPFEYFSRNDWAIFLNLIKYGDFNIINEIMMYEYETGLTGKGMIESLKHYRHNFLEGIFPWLPLTIWCYKNLGSNVFFKNVDYFIQLQIEGIVAMLIDVLRKIKNRCTSEKKV